ncbi:hypothetical protein BOC35_25725 [Burkholderia pseudomallei]|nr:hypothetical protein BOC35_25725 [Burkholderia pseudomallei]
MNTSQREHTPRSQETRKPRHAQNVLSTDMWERIQERAARELSRPRQMFLPGLEPTMRAMPNHIARSSLFAPLSKTHQRRFLNDHILISRRDVVIRFTGIQLDESQADVWMQLMHIAAASPLGEPFDVRSASILEAMGRQIGGAEYRWLRRAVEALYKATLIIDVVNKYCIGDGDSDGDGIRMIDRFRYDATRKQYTLVRARFSCLSPGAVCPYRHSPTVRRWARSRRQRSALATSRARRSSPSTETSSTIPLRPAVPAAVTRSSPASSKSRTVHFWSLARSSRAM